MTKTLTWRNICRGGYRTATTSKMEHFVIILDVAAVLDPSLHLNKSKIHFNDKGSCKLSNILVNYSSSIYNWFDINKPFVNINNHDITSIIRDVSTESVSKARQPMPNRNLEFEIFGHKFKPLCTSSLHRIIVAQIKEWC